MVSDTTPENWNISVKSDNIYVSRNVTDDGPEDWKDVEQDGHKYEYVNKNKLHNKHYFKREGSIRWQEEDFSWSTGNFAQFEKYVTDSKINKSEYWKYMVFPNGTPAEIVHRDIEIKLDDGIDVLAYLPEGTESTTPCDMMWWYLKTTTSNNAIWELVGAVNDNLTTHIDVLPNTIKTLRDIPDVRSKVEILAHNHDLDDCNAHAFGGNFHEDTLHGSFWIEDATFGTNNLIIKKVGGNLDIELEDSMGKQPNDNLRCDVDLRWKKDQLQDQFWVHDFKVRPIEVEFKLDHGNDKTTFVWHEKIDWPGTQEWDTTNTQTWLQGNTTLPALHSANEEYVWKTIDSAGSSVDDNLTLEGLKHIQKNGCVTVTLKTKPCDMTWNYLKSADEISTTWQEPNETLGNNDEYKTNFALPDMLKDLFKDDSITKKRVEILTNEHDAKHESGNQHSSHCFHKDTIHGLFWLENVRFEAGNESNSPTVLYNNHKIQVKEADVIARIGSEPKGRYDVELSWESDEWTLKNCEAKDVEVEFYDASADNALLYRSTISRSKEVGDLADQVSAWLIDSSSLPAGFRTYDVKSITLDPLTTIDPQKQMTSDIWQSFIEVGRVKFVLQAIRKEEPKLLRTIAPMRKPLKFNSGSFRPIPSYGTVLFIAKATEISEATEKQAREESQQKVAILTMPTGSKKFAVQIGEYDGGIFSDVKWRTWQNKLPDGNFPNLKFNAVEAMDNGSIKIEFTWNDKENLVFLDPTSKPHSSGVLYETKNAIEDTTDLEWVGLGDASTVHTMWGLLAVACFIAFSSIFSGHNKPWISYLPKSFVLASCFNVFVLWAMEYWSSCKTFAELFRKGFGFTGDFGLWKKIRLCASLIAIIHLLVTALAPRSTALVMVGLAWLTNFLAFMANWTGWMHSEKTEGYFELRAPFVMQGWVLLLVEVCLWTFGAIGLVVPMIIKKSRGYTSIKNPMYSIKDYEQMGYVIERKERDAAIAITLLLAVVLVFYNSFRRFHTARYQRRFGAIELGQFDVKTSAQIPLV